MNPVIVVQRALVDNDGRMRYDRRTSLMILSALPGLGPVNIGRLDKALAGRVERLLEMRSPEREKWCSRRVVEELGIWKSYFDPQKVMASLEGMGADFVTFEEADYPERLRHFGDRPVGLYRYRSGKTIPRKCIAIVGTRRPSAYGRKVTRDLAAELCRNGFCITSGLAEGVDTEAHRAALECGGLTVAILGGGLNRCYPASNRELLERIKDSGGVWTEFPLGRRADRRSFPQRNRIVSGVSEAVLVIESGTAGGSLITARMASEQGKPVYVIPGRIDAPESAGCHALIRDGAQLVTSVDEILQDLRYLPQDLQAASEHSSIKPGKMPTGCEPELSGLSARIWKLLGALAAAHVDRIAQELDTSAAEVSRHVLEMEVDGLLCRRLDGLFERS